MNVSENSMIRGLRILAVVMLAAGVVGLVGSDSLRWLYILGTGGLALVCACQVVLGFASGQALLSRFEKRIEEDQDASLARAGSGVAGWSVSHARIHHTHHPSRRRRREM